MHTITSLPNENQERWLTKSELGSHYGMGKRWIEKQTALGMPHRKFGNANRYRLSQCDAWLLGRYPAAA